MPAKGDVLMHASVAVTDWSGRRQETEQRLLKGSVESDDYDEEYDRGKVSAKTQQQSDRR